MAGETIQQLVNDPDVGAAVAAALERNQGTPGLALEVNDPELARRLADAGHPATVPTTNDEITQNFQLPPSMLERRGINALGTMQGFGGAAPDATPPEIMSDVSAQEGALTQPSAQPSEGDGGLGGDILASEAAREAQLAALGPQRATTETVRRGPLFGREKELTGRARELQAQQEASLSEGKRQVDDVRKESEELRNGIISQREQYLERIGKKGDAIDKRLGALDEQIKNASEDLSKNKIEFLGSMSNTSRMLVGIASVLEAGSAAIRGMKNPGRVLAQAIETDLELQRTNLQRRLNSVQMSQKERDSLLGRWDKIENKRRAAATDIATLQLGKSIAKEKSLSSILKLEQTINETRQELFGTEADIMAKSGKDITRTTQTTPRTAAGAGKAAQPSRS